MINVFIDGSAGTTGLRIYERLKARNDIKLNILSDELRKDVSARAKALNSADVAFLCLPDAAAKEAVNLVSNSNTVIIDTSTAHRTADGWAYGLPELHGGFEKIRNSNRIANPGCHASGFISLVAPLTESGLINKDIKLTCFSLTGYSGGGKKMIADYETEENKELLKAPRVYALTQEHKHLSEMVKICGLENAPVFCPTVSSYFAGMEVTVPLFMSDVKGSLEDIVNVYKTYYTGDIIKYIKADENGFLSAGKLAGFDGMEISVYGNSERVTLVSRFDNLGKGASGAAIQNMNIRMGLNEKTGLILKEI